MKPLANRLLSFRQGRVNARAEARTQLIIRNNLEKRFYKRMNTLLRKFLNVQLYLYTEYGISNAEVAAQAFNEDFIPLIQSHYKRVFQAVYKNNEDKYMSDRKADTFVFGTSIDFEAVVSNYFMTRELVLAGVGLRMALRISNLIESGRANGLTLPQIAREVSTKFTAISRGRAALIARTETHNAASFANHAYHLTAEKNLGTKMLKQWVSTNDARTRSAHSIANGQSVDMNEDFIVGGVAMGYAGDSKGGARNVINCRCIIIYADEADVVSN